MIASAAALSQNPHPNKQRAFSHNSPIVLREEDLVLFGGDVTPSFLRTPFSTSQSQSSMAVDKVLADEQRDSKLSSRLRSLRSSITKRLSLGDNSRGYSVETCTINPGKICKRHKNSVFSEVPSNEGIENRSSEILTPSSKTARLTSRIFSASSKKKKNVDLQSVTTVTSSIDAVQIDDVKKKIDDVKKKIDDVKKKTGHRRIGHGRIFGGKSPGRYSVLEEVVEEN